MDLAVPTLPAISETVVRLLASTKLQGYEYLCWYMAIIILFVTLVMATVLKSREKPDETSLRATKNHQATHLTSGWLDTENFPSEIKLVAFLLSLVNRKLVFQAIEQ